MKLPFIKRKFEGWFILLLVALLVLVLAFNIILIPFVIKWVLGAFGIKISYWIGLGIWVLIGAVVGMLKPKVNYETKR